jgi:hypothetical protein
MIWIPRHWGRNYFNYESILMKKLITILLLTAASTSYAFGILSGETISGVNRICFYDTPGGTVAITVGLAELCPLSVD